MSKNQSTRIELTENHSDTSDHQRLGHGVELEKRYTPLLVVIAIIAILIGLLVPAIQS